MTLTGDTTTATRMTSELLKTAVDAHVPPGVVELYSRALDACRAHERTSALFPDLPIEQREVLALAEGAQLDIEVIAEVMGLPATRCQAALSLALRHAIPRRGHASSVPRLRRSNGRSGGGRR